MKTQEKIIAQNRRARFDYSLEEVFEAGLVLTGSEVKSLRHGRANIQESFASKEGNDLFLINSSIEEWKTGGVLNHEPRRPRKLLLKRKEINRLLGAIERKGYTLVPVKMYFNPRGKIKIELGLGKGKTSYDKRQSQKDQDWKREKSRLLKTFS